MALNLAKAVIGYLKERPEQKFTARQIAEWVFASIPDECQEKRAKSRGDYIKSGMRILRSSSLQKSARSVRVCKRSTQNQNDRGTAAQVLHYSFGALDSAEVAAAACEDVGDGGCEYLKTSHAL